MLQLPCAVRRRWWLAPAMALLLSGVAPAWSQTGSAGSTTATTAGEFWAEPPTLRSLGFEWRISGDDNRNAGVAVSYRKKGDASWRKALPLLRLQCESVIGGLPRDGSGEHFNKYMLPPTCLRAAS
jgi:hypothetical protein